MRSSLPSVTACIALALLSWLVVPAAAEDMLRVEVDHARVLKIDRPAATVIVGNPSIVDVTVNDSSTLVLTGRSYGITNLVVLDGDGKAIMDESVAVQSFEEKTVRVYRQASRVTYACAPSCEPTVTIGDESSAFDAAAQQYATRQTMATGAK
ncbi:pilus assembly protein N-terminal domain-containing protein [Mangrovicella endophytica]|uniref:pilus assembly protein N-terminal domain-containing protein n=1 Tax=Mangrovicella endophytica TaxID=2066697 RepID=UPI000C9E7C96|nr:pilus assembly protein N-terminal domain-containing protein [Mangrovicella endophytica]